MAPTSGRRDRDKRLEPDDHAGESERCRLSFTACAENVPPHQRGCGFNRSVVQREDESRVQLYRWL